MIIRCRSMNMFEEVLYPRQMNERETFPMNFESLPNEIFSLCFEYFLPWQIFELFDGLNNRFDRLIRTIPLHLNFKNVSKTIFDSFSKRISKDRNILTQISSLCLSNVETIGQIEFFLKQIPLNRLINLRKLILIQIEENTLEILQSMIFFPRQLSSLEIIHSRIDLSTLILPTDQLREISSIKDLKLLHCPSDYFYQIVQFTPYLTNLHLDHFSSSTSESSIHYDLLPHLKRLILTSYQSDLIQLEIFFKVIPHLQYLKITSNDNSQMIDAQKWKDLIQCSFSSLKTFRFQFQCSFLHFKEKQIIDKFTEFQSDFWIKEHQWDSEYIITDMFGTIFSSPYSSSRLELIPFKQIYFNPLTNPFNRFSHVRKLILSSEIMKEKSLFYLNNVRSLKIYNENCSFWIDEDPLLRDEQIHSLQTIVNLSNLKHLDLSSYTEIENISSLFQFFEQSTNISSISIHFLLIKFFILHQKFSKYFKERITKLELVSSTNNSSLNFEDMKNLSQIFLNIKQIKSPINDIDYLIFLLDHFPHLSIIHLHSTTFNPSLKDSLIDLLIKRNLLYHFQEEKVQLHLWI